MERRIYGLETEYGITCVSDHGRPLGADEIARYLFRSVVEWGRSSNVFLRNGSRLYLDVGSHPEYATAECDSLLQLVRYDRAGERIVADLADDAAARLAQEGVTGRIHLFKNNLDSAGNSFGCHENYLVRRHGEFAKLVNPLIPFLVTRQILTGAGRILTSGGGPRYCFSQRADQMWESVSSATTKSRPIINSRDEPHADAERFRRLHIIVGDSSVAEPTTLLKVGSTALVLSVLESTSLLRDLALDDPIRAIRDVSRSFPTGGHVRLATGRSISTVDLQELYLQRCSEHLAEVGFESDAAEREAGLVLDLWRRGIDAVRAEDPSGVDRELDWAIKWRLIERHRARHGVELDDPSVARLELAYHDVSHEFGLSQRLEESGQMRRLSDEGEVQAAKSSPPTTTRAKLRGAFVTAAQEKKRDYTVDWVHVKLNDQPSRTVALRDPFRSEDERVDRLIASL